MNDLKFALRQLLKNPSFTAVAVLTLALGIGANTAIFSVFDVVLLKPLPYPESERLVTLTDRHQKGYTRGTSFPNFLDWRQQNTVCEELAAIQNASFNLAGDGEPERVLAQRVTAGFFPVLGVKPLLGRWFTPDEDTLNAERVAVIAHGMWRRRFSSRADILGQRILLNEQSYTIVGVMPDGFRTVTGNLYQPADAAREVWTPLATDATRSPRGAVFLRVIGRLKPGVSVDSAASELDAIAGRLAEQYPNVNAGFGLRVRGMHRDLGEQIRPTIWILMGAVLLLLVIACANVANLFLVRAAARASEMSIRAALGAGRGRILRQLLTESALIALCGGVLGIAFAWTGVDLLQRFLPPGQIPLQAATVNLKTLGFSLGVSLAAGLLFGLAPALHAAKVNLNDALKSAAKGTAGVGRNRLRNSFVVAELTLALMLLSSAGLVIKSLGQLLQVNPGFRAENVMTMRVALPSAKYGEQARTRAFYQQLMDQVKALPGVDSVGAVSDAPMSGSIATSAFVIDGKPAAAGEMIYTDMQVATPDYFATMGIPLQKGRLLSEQDHEGTTPVAVINQAMAIKFWAGEDPIGRTIVVGGQRYAIVGIVGDVRHFGLNATVRPETYVPHVQQSSRTMTLVVRSRAVPSSLARDISAQMKQLDPNVPLADVRTLEAAVANTTSDFRAVVFLLGAFACAALLLAALGLYGVISYSVAQRTREIGIRMALGAQMADVRRMIVRQGLLLTLAGLGLGLAASLASGRVLTSLLYEVKATDPLTFVVVSAILVAIALLACLIPSHRATRVHPMEALRHE